MGFIYSAELHGIIDRNDPAELLEVVKIYQEASTWMREEFGQ